MTDGFPTNDKLPELSVDQLEELIIMSEQRVGQLVETLRDVAHPRATVGSEAVENRDYQV